MPACGLTGSPAYQPRPSAPARRAPARSASATAESSSAPGAVAGLRSDDAAASAVSASAMAGSCATRVASAAMSGALGRVAFAAETMPRSASSDRHATRAAAGRATRRWRRSRPSSAPRAARPPPRRAQDRPGRARPWPARPPRLARRERSSARAHVACSRSSRQLSRHRVHRSDASLSWFALNPLRIWRRRASAAPVSPREPILADGCAAGSDARGESRDERRCRVVRNCCKSFTGTHIDARLHGDVYVHPRVQAVLWREQLVGQRRDLLLDRHLEELLALLQAQRAHRRPRREQRLEDARRVAGVIFVRRRRRLSLSRALVPSFVSPGEGDLRKASEKFPSASRPLAFFFSFSVASRAPVSGGDARETRERSLSWSASNAVSCLCKKSGCSRGVARVAHGSAPPPRLRSRRSPRAPTRARRRRWKREIAR